MFFQKTPNSANLHLRRVIFILRIQNFETSKNCSLFPVSSPFSTQKSRTEVRDFCLHLFCQCNLVRHEGFEPPAFWSVARRSIQLS